MRHSLLELKRQNLELTKQNEEKDQELDRLRKALEQVHSPTKLDLAYQKIRALEQRNLDVRIVRLT